MSSERTLTIDAKLWAAYDQRRARWNTLMMDALVAEQLPSYLKAPKDQLLIAIGRSMDLLVQAMRESNFDEYVGLQRDNIRARIKAGILLEDLNAAQRVGTKVMEQLVDSVPCDEADRQELHQRLQRFMQLTADAVSGVT